MRTGHLKGIVLNCLQDNPNSGYGIMARIKGCTGWKPSTGSIYPILSDLKEEGLVTERKTAKKNIYNITPKGKELLTEMKGSHEKIMEETRKMIKTMGTLMGHDETEMLEEMDKQFKEGKVPFHEILDESIKMKRIIAKLSREGKLKKNPDKINKILAKANAELERI